MLPTAPLISYIFLIFSLIKSSNNNLLNYFKDKWNRIFIFISICMIVSSILVPFNGIQFYKDTWDLKLTWIGLFNWIPFFWVFWGFQPYLNDPKNRKYLINFLISGSIPVILTGFMQTYFNLNGPFQIFNGLIIWYLKPIKYIGGLTGPFNNPNYAGEWLAIVWPFILGSLLIKKNFNVKKVIIFIISLIFVWALILTNSRNAWLGMLISIPIVKGANSFMWLIPIISLVIIFFIGWGSISLTFQKVIIDFLDTILPINIMSNFPNISQNLFENYPRFDIWISSIDLIRINPLIGWGGGSFPIIYEQLKGKWFGHPHNIFLELTISYGIISALTLCITIIFLLFKSYKAINYLKKFKSLSKNSIYNYAWLSSSLFICYSHLFDIQYFDLRISIITWILFSGLRSLIAESKNLKLEIKKN